MPKPMPSAPDPFDILGDPTRREILRLLSAEPRAVGSLAAALPVSRPAVSRHLRLLESAGFVEAQPKGTQRIYHLRAGGLDAVEAYLRQVWGDAAARFRLVAEDSAPLPPGDGQ